MSNTAHQNWLRDNGDPVLRLNYPLDKDSLVLDIGGYEGSWSQAIYDKYGCNVNIYEPVKSFFTKISNSFEDTDKVKVFNVGVAAESGDAVIFIPENGKDSSNIFLGEGAKETIKLESIVELIPEGGVDLLKLNIEGCEYDLLDCLIDNNLHLKVKNIQIQFHDFFPDSKERRDKIRESLKGSHKETYCYPFIWENWELL
jgi:FkbM family methyltransferase